MWCLPPSVLKLFLLLLDPPIDLLSHLYSFHRILVMTTKMLRVMMHYEQSPSKIPIVQNCKIPKRNLGPQWWCSAYLSQVQLGTHHLHKQLFWNSLFNFFATHVPIPQPNSSIPNRCCQVNGAHLVLLLLKGCLGLLQRALQLLLLDLKTSPLVITDHRL